MSNPQHGYNCPKVPHDGKTGWLHEANDDSPYDVDGAWYCGRCHAALPDRSFYDRHPEAP